MSGRIVVATIGIAYLLYCIFVAIVTFLGKNVATLHLNSSYYKLAFAALYAVLSPFGLSGILGAIHRRKNLIKGFLWQYWVGTLLISGANVASVIYSHAKQRDIFRECGSERLFDPSAVPDCTEFVRSVQKNAFIAAVAQGSAMILIGLLLLIVGGREFNDIKIDEETSNLLDKGLFENNDKPEPFGRIITPAVNPPDATYTPTVPFRTPANNNSSPYGAYGLDRKASLASTAYGLEHKPSIASSTSSYGQNPYGRRQRPMNGGGGRDMYLTPNPMNGAAQAAPARSQGLYRQPTGSSTYSDRTLHSPPIPDIPYERIQTQTTRPPYIKPPERSYANDGSYLIYGAQGGQQQQQQQQQPPDDYDNYWQPTAAKTLASNVNRMNMY